MQSIRVGAAAFILCIISCVSLARGAWTPNGVAVCTASGDQVQPQIISDNRNGAIVVWKDNRKGKFRHTSTLNSEYNDPLYSYFVQRIDASGKPVWAADGIQVSADDIEGDDQQSGIMRRLGIVGDGSGGAIIVWDGRDDDKWFVFAQRIDSLGRAMWGDNGYALCSGRLVNDAIVEDGSGGAILILFEDSSKTTHVQRIDSAHRTIWDVNPSPSIISNASWIFSDGFGGIIILWKEGEVYLERIFAQRLDSNGNALWGPKGRQITEEHQNPDLCFLSLGNPYYIAAYKAEYRPYDPCYIGIAWFDSEGNIKGKAQGDGWLDPQVRSTAIAPDGANGIIYAFHNLSSSFLFGKDKFSICANRISIIGKSLWKGKKRLCNSEGNQLFPCCVTDAAQGAIIAWEDHRAGKEEEPDIFAQRIDPSGNPVWVNKGVPICSARGNQSHIAVIPDGAGGAIIAWEDGRNGQSDIYIQRITAFGGILSQ